MYGFDDIIAKEFETIRAKFKIKSENLYGEFDEDVLIDAYIRCRETLSLKSGLSKEEYIRYFWTAYANAFKTYQSSPFKTNVIFMEDASGERMISLSEKYNINIDITCEMIINSIKDKFGEDKTSAWLLHIHENKSYKDLEAMGYDFKFNDVFKKITKWVRLEFKDTYNAIKN